MPTLAALPNATGSYTQWTVSGGSRPSCVQTNDGDTTKVALTSGTTGIDTYHMTNLPGAANQVTSVASGCYIRRTAAGGGTCNVTMYDGTLGYSSGFSLNISYTAHYYSFNPPSGGSWTPAIWNSAQAGPRRSVAGAAGCYCTMVYSNVVYTLAAGGFIYLLHSILAAVGGGVTLSHLPGMARDIFHQTRSIIRPDEYAEAFREWSTWTRPVYVF